MNYCAYCGDGFYPTETSDREFCSWECAADDCTEAVAKWQQADRERKAGY